MGLKLPSLRINRTWLMLLAAIGLALLATFLTTRYLASREASIEAELAARSQKGGPRVAVAVAVRDLPVGAPLTENLVAAREVAADLLYPNAILADDFDKYKGQALIRSVLKGRPLLKTDLKPEVADFSGTLADGIRAITVDIDELNAVAHMVQPGNRVDLMLAMQREEGGQTVVPFMDRMKVLATGQRVVHESEEKPGSRKTSTYSTLTLEVTPSQAARLTLAQSIGKLRYVLRNENDEGSVDFAVTAQNIFDEISQRARNAKRSTSLAGVVEYIIGGQRSGPSLKAVDVPVAGAADYSAVSDVPPLVPAIAPLKPSAAAAAGTAAAAAAKAAVTGAAPAAAPAAAPTAAPTTPAVSTTGTTSGTDANGLTPQLKADLKALIEK